MTLASCHAAHGQRFFPDDPLQKFPEVAPAAQLSVQKIDPLYDLAIQSAHYKVRPASPASATNTLGEVPDSSWFTNRSATRSRDELKRGGRTHGGPVPPFTVTSAKTEGVTPGFRIRDARGLTYFVKVDPPSNPEMATSADVMGALFLYALGYNVPENYILLGRRDQFQLSDKARISLRSGKSHPMTHKQLDDILDRVPTRPDGRIRVMASLSLPGKIIGPFLFTGTRTDDPNDLVPHEQRRDLRGLEVAYAWLNHTDSKADNSLDTVEGKGDQARVVHHLLDFGDSFGSDSDIAKDPRHGEEYLLPTGKPYLKKVYTFGLRPAAWETVHYPHNLPAVGNFTSVAFDPLTWKPNYPNPAFLATTPEDAYWEAKKIAALGDDDIHAIVEEGQLTDPRATDYIASTLEQRRDAVTRAWFARVLPLEDFHLEGTRLRFTDLASPTTQPSPTQYDVHWFRWNNTSGHQEGTGEAASLDLPSAFTDLTSGAYIGCTITLKQKDARSVTVFFRRADQAWTVAGINRTSR